MKAQAEVLVRFEVEGRDATECAMRADAVAAAIDLLEAGYLSEDYDVEVSPLVVL